MRSSMSSETVCCANLRRGTLSVQEITNFSLGARNGHQVHEVMVSNHVCDPQALAVPPLSGQHKQESRGLVIRL